MKNLEFENFEKTWNFEQRSLKNFEFQTVFTSEVMKFRFDTINLSVR